MLEQAIATGSMSVLVTGGAGFIGSHSVERLLAAGCRVRVLDNFSSGHRDNLASHPALEVRTGDVRQAPDVESALEGISHVLHLAAQVSVQASVEHPAASFAHNAQGFMNVLDAARRAQVTRLVYASSAAVYGHTAEVAVTEATPPRPLSPYGLEKLLNDQYAALFHDLYGFSSIGLRYFNVYGPRQDPTSPYAGVISRFVHLALHGEPLTVYGDGRQTRDFVYVGDIAEVNFRALSGSAVGVLNVGTGQRISLLDLIEALGEAVGRSLEVRHLPERRGDIRHSATSVAHLERALGFTPATRPPQGLARLVGDQRV
jgi:UDP-glucose 4-epimerase